MRKLIILIFISLFLISCSKKQAEVMYEYSDHVVDFEEESFVNTSAVRMSESVVAKKEVASLDEMNGNNYNSANTADFERKLIKTGSVQLTVKSLEDSDANIEKWTKKYGGYIANSNMYETSCRYTVKIPAENFDEAMNSVSEFGKIRNRSVNVKDVTDQFYDLQGRLETKKILQEKYNQYLKKADKMKDLLEVERELNSVISEIESMEGQMQRLSHQISYSTIEISFTAVSTPRTIDTYINKIRWKSVLANIVNFFIKIFLIIIYVIVIGIPLIAFAAFLFWLLFGKIGLLKKLFSKLRGKKNNE